MSVERNAFLKQFAAKAFSANSRWNPRYWGRPVFALASTMLRWPRTSTVCLVLVVGGVDYLTNFGLSLSVFYLLAIGIAAWFVSRGFAIGLSVLSVIVWLGAQYAAGARYYYSSVPTIWNSVSLLVSYLVVVWLLRSLRALHDELEARVRQRTAALIEEATERDRLEKEVLNIGERERQRIGHDLHDSLCQHLTAAALAGQVLQEKLGAKLLPEATDASSLVQLVEQAVEDTRQLARGLAPIELTGEGLMDSLRELAVMTEERSKIHCDFICEKSALINDSAIATHLYRIAQEAVNNAIKHAKPSHIVIRISGSHGQIELVVRDDGVGFPPVPPKNRGMGMWIMNHRAGMIGASLVVRSPVEGGTVVSCSLRGNL